MSRKGKLVSILVVMLVITSLISFLAVGSVGVANTIVFGYMLVLMLILRNKTINWLSFGFLMMIVASSMWYIALGVSCSEWAATQSISALSAGFCVMLIVIICDIKVCNSKTLDTDNYRELVRLVNIYDAERKKVTVSSIITILFLQVWVQLIEYLTEFSMNMVQSFLFLGLALVGLADVVTVAVCQSAIRSAKLKAEAVADELLETEE